MTHAICLVIGLLAGVALTYWAMKIDVDVGSFTEYHE
jgi:hypothetical protein